MLVLFFIRLSLSLFSCIASRSLLQVCIDAVLADRTWTSDEAWIYDTPNAADSGLTNRKEIVISSRGPREGRSRSCSRA